jgi:hypothetical protein
MPTDVTELLRRGREILEKEAFDARSVGFAARALVQATLPHSRLLGNEYVRRNGHYTLTMLSPSHIGLPYGVIPRLLLVWLTTEVVRTKSRTIVLGQSMAKFMSEVGLGNSTGGEFGTITRFKEQVMRLFATTISITRTEQGRHHDVGFRIADESLLFWEPDPGSPSRENSNIVRISASKRVPSVVRVSQPLFDEIIAHPIPIDLRAIRALKKSPMCIDLYCWLTYRASYATQPAIIPWDRLVEQFGANYSKRSDFAIAFREALAKVKVVYPATKVDFVANGLLIAPGRPHIRRTTAAPKKSG